MKDDTKKIIGGFCGAMILSPLLGLFSGTVNTLAFNCQNDNYDYYNASSSGGGEECKLCDDADPFVTWFTRIFFSIFLPCLSINLWAASQPSDTESEQRAILKKGIPMGTSILVFFYLSLILGGYLADKFMMPKTQDCSKLKNAQVLSDTLLFSLATLISQGITLSSIGLWSCLHEKLTTRRHERLLDKALKMSNYGTQLETPPANRFQP